MRSELQPSGAFFDPSACERETAATRAQDPHDELVYVLDDHPAALLEIFDFLTRAGFRVAASTNPRSGLSYIARHHPRAAIVNFDLREMTGVEVLERLRREAPGTRVIVLSSCVDWDLREEVLVRGGAVLLSHRVSAAAMLGALSRVLQTAPAESGSGTDPEAPLSEPGRPGLD